LETLQKFSNPDEPNSLSQWALERIEKSQQGFSKEEESLLVYIHRFERKKNDDFKRYIENPDELFDNLRITTKEEKGFWISLEGIYEYISYYSDKQILDTNDIKKIKISFIERRKNLEKELKRLKYKKQRRSRLYQAVHDYSNRKVFDIYPQKIKIFSFEIIKGLTSEFDEKLKRYNQRDIIEKQYNSYGDRKKELETIQTKIEQLAERKDELINTIGDNNEKALKFENQEFEETIEKCNKKLDRYKRRYVSFDKALKTIRENVDSFSNLEKKLGKNETNIKTSRKNTLNLFRELRNTTSQLHESENEFFAKMQKPFSLKMPRIKEADLQKLEIKFEASRTSFEDYHEKEILKLISEDKRSHFEDQYDVNQIGRELLPEMYRQSEIIEEKLIEQVRKYLEDINYKMLEISKKYLKNLRSAFYKTHEACRRYAESYREIKSFLEKENTHITGGHTAVLNMDNDKKDYNRNIISKIITLLSNDTEIMTILQDKNKTNSVEEIIKEKYKEITKRAIAPSIEKLLNPRITLSYLSRCPTKREKSM